MSETEFNDMQLVKRRFFAMRNGVIADTLRKAGLPFSIIFGLNLPQLNEIAEMFGPSRELAEKLWANTTTRESMLLAPMLMPREEFTVNDARRWVSQVPTMEVADMLCFKLLKHLEFASELVAELTKKDDRMSRYTALRLMMNIASRYPDLARDTAECFKKECGDDKVLEMLANQLADCVL